MGRRRIKSPNKKYHVYGHGMVELAVFSDEHDKAFFLELLQTRSERYNFTIHSYIIMDTHYHFSGMDNDDNLSKMMQSILTSYAMYYNKKHKRRGHVFMERFRSRPLKDWYDMLNITSYIHSNPHSIEEYRGRVEKYKFSSLGIYIGEVKQVKKFVDITFIMEIVSIKDVAVFNKTYFEYIKANLKS